MAKDIQSLGGNQSAPSTLSIVLVILTKFNHCRIRIYCSALKKNSDPQVTAAVTVVIKIHSESVVCQFPLAKMRSNGFLEKCVDLQVTGGGLKQCCCGRKQENNTIFSRRKIGLNFQSCISPYLC